jgi:hypothetical protein
MKKPRSAGRGRPVAKSKTPPGAKANRMLTRQNRKLLGNHYANRYHTRRG